MKNSKHKVKIVIIIPSMTLGGAEKVVSILLKYLSREKFEIVLMLIKKEGVFVDEIAEDIEVIDLGIRKIRYSLPKISRMLRKIKPDIVFSTLGYLNIFLLLFRFCFPAKIKFIARESNIPSRINNDEKHPFLFNFLYRVLYPRLDKIICQSLDMKNDLVASYNILEEKIEIINNPLDLPSINSLMGDGVNLFYDKQKINLLAVGRLEYQKGFDLLIRSFARIDPDLFHLTIIGEGNEKGNLLKLADTLKVRKGITFTGYQKNPYSWMRYADLFILSSRYEGFPNAVLEAMACGTPVMAFECPGGVNEIVIEGLNGVLVKNGNFESMATKISCFERNFFDRNKITQSVSERYGFEKIIYKYDKMFKEMGKGENG